MNDKRVYLLYEGFHNGREVKERLEYVALTPEAARAWVHGYFPERYSRTSMPIKVFECEDKAAEHSASPTPERSAINPLSDESGEKDDQDLSRSDQPQLRACEADLRGDDRDV